jgi:hypothetical protein
MPYTEFVPTVPDGANPPATFSGDALNNIVALRDMMLTGRPMPGFLHSKTAGAYTLEQPEYVTWYKASGTVGFRMKNTWTGGKLTTIDWEYTTNGATWYAMGTPQINTYSGDDIISTTVSGNFFTLVVEIWVKCLRAAASLATHIAGTGSGVHGLGTIATQSATAAALSGSSTLDGTGGVGQTTPPPVDATRIREKFNDYGAIAAAGTVTLELDKYGHFAFTPHATTSSTITVAVSGTPAAGKSETWTVEILNGQRDADGRITWAGSFKWVGGSVTRPLDTALELSGRNFFILQCRDGGTRHEIQYIGKGG